ncbi:DUF1822 family protein [Scytonema sp. NUACC26]|uniref:DUF1822 family protein n=1 Tax=Scytonema sp. NUACC26 TaxID=3140176 RepID=UPI0034DC223E
MTINLNDLTLIYPEHLCLDISTEEQEAAWEQTMQESYSNTAARWNAYLNHLSLNTFLTWLEEDPDLQVPLRLHFPKTELPSIWEVVNGSVLTLGETRLVLIPSDKSYFPEFCIPQEWVDIPNWSTHYYIAVQLDLEECWLRVWGYTTHKQVREQATYDPTDRTYCLDMQYLVADLNVMWVTQELCPLGKLEVKSLPTLSAAQAEQLLEQLSQQTVSSPKFNIPFDMWGALLEVDEFRKHLYQRWLEKQKSDRVEAIHKVTSNLSLWFQNIFSAGWQNLDDLLSVQQKALMVQFRNDFGLNEKCVKRAKLIDLGIQFGSSSFVLLIGLKTEVDGKIGVRVQLHPANEEVYLIPDLRLILLSQTGTILQEVSSRSDDHYIQLKKFKSSPGICFSVQVALNDVSIKEDFVLEAVDDS